MIEIRQTGPEDRLLIEKMYLEEVESHPERARKFAEDLIEHFKTIIALEENQLCGTLTWDRRGGYDDGVVEIIGLGVNEKSQRRGIASKLVNVFIDTVSKLYTEKGYALRVVMLFMEGKNEIARKFYSNLGFIESARLPSFYPHDDGVIWTKHL